MQYVAQEHDLGCFIAATAMVLDLTYEEASQTVPLQDPANVVSSGVLTLAQVMQLARAHGRIVVDQNPPLTVRAGFRYIAMIATPIPNVYHNLAIDETGIAFDPDPSNEDVRKPWSEYGVLGLLEFRPLQ
jgi:hypothetical protein